MSKLFTLYYGLLAREMIRMCSLILFCSKGFLLGKTLKKSMAKGESMATPASTRSWSPFCCAESKRTWRNLFLPKLSRF